MLRQSRRKNRVSNRDFFQAPSSPLVITASRRQAQPTNQLGESTDNYPYPLVILPRIPPYPHPNAMILPVLPICLFQWRRCIPFAARVVAAGVIEKARDTLWLAGARLVVEVVEENALVDSSFPLDAASVYDFARALDNEHRPSSRRRFGRHPGCLWAPAYNRAGRLLRCGRVPAATRATRYLADSRLSRPPEEWESDQRTDPQIASPVASPS